ncbi:4-oxalocrotonate tautomerase family protein [Sutterella sp.]|uniref:tautomerase family protein n=1 Tax=Sutterella sp. TaxID=1981025 RepID=UPI0026DED78B|nr:4-oxalocrotonate tautomerase family protein [Sutterella sp.]MDO5532839.1 4-oxalocrotonate tautomerase family protein [Sutterella sp.]
MPLITIKVTGGAEAPTPEQKAELLKGATDLVVRVLGKNPATTHVIIEEVDPDNWGVGGLSATVRRNLTSKPAK